MLFLEDAEMLDFTYSPYEIVVFTAWKGLVLAIVGCLHWDRGDCYVHLMMLADLRSPGKRQHSQLRVIVMVLSRPEAPVYQPSGHQSERCKSQDVK